MVVGNHPALGSWDAGRGLALKWHEGHVWAAEAQLDAGAKVEFKVVRLRDGGAATWEDGANRDFKVRARAGGRAAAGRRRRWRFTRLGSRKRC